MRAGEKIRCPHCGEASAAREKKVMEGWKVREIRLVCSFCGGDLGKPDTSEKAAAEAQHKAAGKLASLLGDGARPAPKADLSPTGDYGKFCRNCEYFIAHPFKTVCGRFDREADPMGECEFFVRKAEKK